MHSLSRIWFDCRRIAKNWRSLEALKLPLIAFALPSQPSISDPLRIDAYAVRMLNGIESFLGAPDCARYLVFGGYLAFMRGIVGLANYLDEANAGG
jgi:hypothetical protein